MIKSYKDLDVWKKSIELAKRVYMITKGFPKEEIYGLVNQMRRSAVSISSNIAEGRARQHTNEFVQFLYVALGSCAELETQLFIANELKYCDTSKEKDVFEILDHVGRMIRNLIKSLRVPSSETRDPSPEYRE